MPVIDFHDGDQYDAAIEFLVVRGIAFHTRPPLQVILTSVDYKALEEANLLNGGSEVKATNSRGKKTRSPAKSKTRRAS